MTLCEAIQCLEINESHRQEKSCSYTNLCQVDDQVELPIPSPMSGLIDLYKRTIVTYQLENPRDDWFYEGRPTALLNIAELGQKDPELLRDQIMERIDYYLQTLQEYSNPSNCSSDDDDDDAEDSLIAAFSAKNPPRISILDYLERFRHYCRCDEIHIITALFHLTKLIFSDHHLKLTKYNIHRFVMASLVVTLKYNSDFYLSNKGMTRVSGIKLEELNRLEHYFLSLVDFQLYTSEEEFTAFSALFLDTYRKIQKEQLFGFSRFVLIFIATMRSTTQNDMANLK